MLRVQGVHGPSAQGMEHTGSSTGEVVQQSENIPHLALGWLVVSRGYRVHPGTVVTEQSPSTT